MPYRRFISSAKITIFFFGLLVLSQPAFAGFQWVAPEASPGPPPAIIAPPVAMAPEMMAPVTSAPLPQVATEAPEPVAPIIVTGAPATNEPATGGEVVKGFAKQVPIAVALRQILPQGYTFSIDPDVDLTVLVSFQGGHPWRDTLRDALDPVGLVMRENGRMVSIGRPGMGAAPVVSSVPAAVSVASLPEASAPAAASTVQVSSVSAPMPMMTPIQERWHAERGDNLRKVLEDWTRRAGVELNWLAEYDYPVEASVNYNGNFEDAVRNLLVGFSNAHPQPVAELHSNEKIGQNVLVVQSRGNNYSN